MLTEAEQLTLDRTRKEVRELLEGALRDLPEPGEEIGKGDILAVVLLGLGGGIVSDYIQLVKALKESALYNMEAQNG